MENPDANQLPEADALPDGFVESSTEPVAPPTPTVEQEKPLGDYKEDSFSELDHSDKLSTNEFQTSQGREEKTQKLRTFPVPLSETDIFEASEGLGEVSSEGCTEQTEGTLVSPDSANVSEASVGVSGCSEVKEQVQANCQSSERRNYLYLSISPFFFLVITCIFMHLFIFIFIFFLSLIINFCENFTNVFFAQNTTPMRIWKDDLPEIK